MDKIGVLLVNLGTPDSASPLDVKKYLTEFLTDPRVIDLPWWKRQLLVRAIIVPKRYKDSAENYARIWKKEGSPLKVYGEVVKQKLQEALGCTYQVALAMRYQNPTIEKGLIELQQCQSLIVIPLFPQYASATSGSVQEKVLKEVSKWNTIPELHFANSFPREEKMIEAFAERAKERGVSHYDHILFSFHGLPQKQVKKADSYNHCLTKKSCCETLCNQNKNCYSAQCHATAQAIAAKLHISKEHYTICFQSRLGKDPWLLPDIGDELKKLKEKGVNRVLVFSPSFVCDCLETLEEIGCEYRGKFLDMGGEALDLVEGLNDHPLWIEALKEMVLRFAVEKLELNALN